MAKRRLPIDHLKLRKKAIRQKPINVKGLEANGAPIIYIHGIGSKPPKEKLKLEWDIALFGKDMGSRTRMAYWADLLHDMEIEPKRISTRGNQMRLDVDQMLSDAGVDPSNEKAQALADAVLRAHGLQGNHLGKKILPLPAFLRRPIARRFLEAFVKDTAAYFFRRGMRSKIKERFIAELPKGGDPITIIAHSQGSIVAYEVLAAMKVTGGLQVGQLVTIGSPLGVRELQDLLQPDDLKVPVVVHAWNNFTDPLDYVALDKGIGNDFWGEPAIVDEMVMNRHTRTLDGFNPHSAVGYLAHPSVRAVVHRAARFDSRTRFLVARDVAQGLAVDARQPVLIEILEPGYPALDEDRQVMEQHEIRKERGTTSIAERVDRAAKAILAIVPEECHDEARVDKLRRFVAAHLTPRELGLVVEKHKDIRIYAIWKSSMKRKSLTRSTKVVQVDAARNSYKALGVGIRWAVLDTGVRADHPHFTTNETLEAVFDCTKPGRPQLIKNDVDRDGHGTHVSGIIAGSAVDGHIHGMAEKAKIVVYKVLNDRGEGEDAWIIKALDHIAETNENKSALHIHGINLSLGGPYDASVYGCGFTPICMELRRQWRSGVLVCVASGNEGQVEVSTPDGEVELNSPMSIGDPANLEDCIAVGSVNADRPHLFGISSFSSRGPTSDGRVKPDVVAPGERINSCSSKYRLSVPETHYRTDSGTSMAAPHVSGVLAAFLSVRKEFIGRPDEVKELLLRTCTDLKRDRYHQGHGVPNLMRMLLDA